MRVRLDTTSVLDVLLDRVPFVHDSSALWAACDAGRLVGMLPASTLTDIFYSACRTTDLVRARVAVGLCLAAFEIAPVDRQTLEDAIALPGNDFEDNVQIACATRTGVDAIVTRNRDDFAHAPIPVLTPAEHLTRLSTFAHHRSIPRCTGSVASCVVASRAISGQLWTRLL